MSDFRAVAGHFVTGVTVVTACLDDGVPIGMTVNAFSSVSLDPLLVLVCVHNRSRLSAAVEHSGAFAVTVLAADQQDCARTFATSGRPTGVACFEGIPTGYVGESGCPVLLDGVAYFDCYLEQRHPAGDHTVLIGRVASFGVLRPAPALVFANGQFGSLERALVDYR